MYHIFLIHSSVVEHLGCFSNLTIVTNVGTNMGMLVSLLYPDLHSFSYMPTSDILGSYGGIFLVF
jgi:hypothetical protein